MQYDGLDRLTSTTGGNGIGSSLMRYDSFGNITYYRSKKRTNDYSYNYTTNMLTSVNSSGVDPKNYTSFQDDGKGNITNNSHQVMEYNLANQMTSAKGTNTYLYDGFNRRVKQTDAKGTSYSVYSQSGTLLLRETSSGQVNYIYLDGKVLAKVGITESPNGPNQHFAPFGSSIEGETDDVGYTGHKFDTDIGLSYMQARYYDPVIGRFYSNDPVDAGAFISQGNIHGFNRYAYVNNNPYKYIDPTGMNPEDYFIPAEDRGNCGCPSPVLNFPDWMFNESSEGGEASEDKPKTKDDISKQKQNKHKEGTKENENAKRGKTPEDWKSTWDNPDEADDLTLEAWEKGELQPDESKGNIKIWYPGRRVGTKGDRSFGQQGIKVIEDSKGKIHGHPVGHIR